MSTYFDKFFYLYLQVLQCLPEYTEVINVLEDLEVLIEFGASICDPVEEILAGTDALPEDCIMIRTILHYYTHQPAAFLIDFDLMESACCIEARKKTHPHTNEENQTLKLS